MRRIGKQLHDDVIILEQGNEREHNRKFGLRDRLRFAHQTRCDVETHARRKERVGGGEGDEWRLCRVAVAVREANFHLVGPRARVSSLLLCHLRLARLLVQHLVLEAALVSEATAILQEVFAHTRVDGTILVRVLRTFHAGRVLLGEFCEFWELEADCPDARLDAFAEGIVVDRFQCESLLFTLLDDRSPTLIARRLLCTLPSRTAVQVER